MYPVRCVIVETEGKTIEMLDGTVLNLVTPEISKSHIGKHGLVELTEDMNVKITLDDGNILYGYECWWKQEAEQND